MNFQQLHTAMVDHLIWLETLDPQYAMWALEHVRREPSGLYRDILADVKAEKARRLTFPKSEAASPIPSPSSQHL